MTKIFSANITIGKEHEFPVRIESVPVKKLPMKLLANEKSFVAMIITSVGATKWKEFSKNKQTGLPEIKIEWLKYLSDIVTEPAWN